VETERRTILKHISEIAMIPLNNRLETELNDRDEPAMIPSYISFSSL
jgi:hypothetical protein